MSPARLRALLDTFSDLTVAVVGDFFVDKYLVIDPSLEETSIETGLPAYQVVDVRCQPGAAGTVTNNLSALAIGALYAVGFRGRDGEGYELDRGLAATRVDTTHLHEAEGRFTPTYTKPLVREADGRLRELNRLDVKNRAVTPRPVEDAVVASLRELAGEVDAIIVGDQVEEPDHGVITGRVRAALAQLAADRPELPIVADSRGQIAVFDGVSIKPNDHEAWAAFASKAGEPTPDGLARVAGRLAAERCRPVFVTMGERGVLAADGGGVTHVPAIEVTGEIDIVGAGDSFCAGTTAALAAGATAAEAAMVGCLVASLTIQQLGTTGTATREEVLARFDQSPYRQL